MIIYGTEQIFNMISVIDDDQSRCDSSSRISTLSGIMFSLYVKTGMIDSFSWHGACQVKPNRTIDTVFDVSILFDEISLITFFSCNDISSGSSEDSLLLCSSLREKTMRLNIKTIYVVIYYYLPFFPASISNF